MRSVPLTLITGLVVAQASAAQASFVELTILGEGGTEQVEIGPAGGLVPYSLFAETDPLGTPDNFGLVLVEITIDTDTAVAQDPVMAFGPTFLSQHWVTSDGLPEDDDIVAILAWQKLSFRPVPILPFLGVGQSGPELFAQGALIVPPAPIGAVFHVSVLIDDDDPRTSSAAVVVTIDAPTYMMAPPDNLFGNTLNIAVVPEPATILLMVISVGMLCRRHRGSKYSNGQNRIT